MIEDKQGNILSGATAGAAGLLDLAVDAFNIFRGDPIAPLDRAIAVAPGFAMAYIAKAHMCALSTEPAAMRAAVALLGKAWSLRLTEREASLVAALGPMLQGEWNAAALALENHTARWPHDLLAIQTGHLVDFLCADARGLRDRIARVLPRWSADMPGYSILLGMYAFGLEEAGDYARAEEMGRRAVAFNPLDCWAHHAVAHVMEMQGRAEDGIGWMIAREDHWSGDDNFFRRHNWWHRALCHINIGQTGEALALYDGPIRQDSSPVAMDMIDASALLWRLHMMGQDVGGRWQELADAWDAHADGRTSGFNDWHAAMAWLGAGRHHDVERLCAALRNAGQSEMADWGRNIALPLIEGFAAFWRGDHEMAVSKLHGVRHVAKSFGGSHAQRDIIDWTLTEAALRGGMTDLAEALAHERLALKPHNPLNLSFLTRARAGGLPDRKAAYKAA